MNSSAPQQLFQQAIQAHQRGDLAQAELFYLQVLKAAPDMAPPGTLSQTKARPPIAPTATVKASPRAPRTV